MPDAWRSVIAATLRRAAWAPTLVFLLHLVLSRGFGAYLRFPLLDVPMHLVGGIAISYFFARGYRIAEGHGLLGRPAGWLYFVVVAALSTASTLSWEFAEYLSDRWLGTRAQLGLEDTLADMLLGCLGATLYLVRVALSSPRSVDRDPSADA